MLPLPSYRKLFQLLVFLLAFFTLFYIPSYNVIPLSSVHAQRAGYCEGGWTFNGGDAGDDANWEYTGCTGSDYDDEDNDRDKWWEDDEEDQGESCDEDEWNDSETSGEFWCDDGRACYRAWWRDSSCNIHEKDGPDCYEDSRCQEEPEQEPEDNSCPKYYQYPQCQPDGQVYDIYKDCNDQWLPGEPTGQSCDFDQSDDEDQEEEQAEENSGSCPDNQYWDTNVGGCVVNELEQTQINDEIYCQEQCGGSCAGALGAKYCTNPDDGSRVYDCNDPNFQWVAECQNQLDEEFDHIGIEPPPSAGAGDLAAEEKTCGFADLDGGECQGAQFCKTHILYCDGEVAGEPEIGGNCNLVPGLCGVAADASGNLYVERPACNPECGANERCMDDGYGAGFCQVVASEAAPVNSSDPCQIDPNSDACQAQQSEAAQTESFQNACEKRAGSYYTECDWEKHSVRAVCAYNGQFDTQDLGQQPGLCKAEADAGNRAYCAGISCGEGFHCEVNSSNVAECKPNYGGDGETVVSENTSPVNTEPTFAIPARCNGILNPDRLDECIQRETGQIPGGGQNDATCRAQTSAEHYCDGNVCIEKSSGWDGNSCVPVYQNVRNNLCPNSCEGNTSDSGEKIPLQNCGVYTSEASRSKCEEQNAQLEASGRAAPPAPVPVQITQPVSQATTLEDCSKYRDNGASQAECESRNTQLAAQAAASSVQKPYVAVSEQAGARCVYNEACPEGGTKSCVGKIEGTGSDVSCKYDTAVNSCGECQATSANLRRQDNRCTKEGICENGPGFICVNNSDCQQQIQNAVTTAYFSQKFEENASCQQLQLCTTADGQEGEQVCKGKGSSGSCDLSQGGGLCSPCQAKGSVKLNARATCNAAGQCIGAPALEGCVTDDECPKPQPVVTTVTSRAPLSAGQVVGSNGNIFDSRTVCKDEIVEYNTFVGNLDSQYSNDLEGAIWEQKTRKEVVQKCYQQYVDTGRAATITQQVVTQNTEYYYAQREAVNATNKLDQYEANVVRTNEIPSTDVILTLDRLEQDQKAALERLKQAELDLGLAPQASEVLDRSTAESQIAATTQINQLVDAEAEVNQALAEAVEARNTFNQIRVSSTDPEASALNYEQFEEAREKAQEEINQLAAIRKESGNGLSQQYQNQLDNLPTRSDEQFQVQQTVRESTQLGNVARESRNQQILDSVETAIDARANKLEEKGQLAIARQIRDQGTQAIFEGQANRIVEQIQSATPDRALIAQAREEMDRLLNLIPEEDKKIALLAEGNAIESAAQAQKNAQEIQSQVIAEAFGLAEPDPSIIKEKQSNLDILTSRTCQLSAKRCDTLKAQIGDQGSEAYTANIQKAASLMVEQNELNQQLYQLERAGPAANPDAQAQIVSRSTQIINELKDLDPHLAKRSQDQLFEVARLGQQQNQVDYAANTYANNKELFLSFERIKNEDISGPLSTLDIENQSLAAKERMQQSIVQMQQVNSDKAQLMQNDLNLATYKIESLPQGNEFISSNGCIVEACQGNGIVAQNICSGGVSGAKNFDAFCAAQNGNTDPQTAWENYLNANRQAPPPPPPASTSSSWGETAAGALSVVASLPGGAAEMVGEWWNREIESKTPVFLGDAMQQKYCRENTTIIPFMGGAIPSDCQVDSRSKEDKDRLAAEAIQNGGTISDMLYAVAGEKAASQSYQDTLKRIADETGINIDTPVLYWTDTQRAKVAQKLSGYYQGGVTDVFDAVIFPTTALSEANAAANRCQQEWGENVCRLDADNASTYLGLTSGDPQTYQRSIDQAKAFFPGIETIPQSEMDWVVNQISSAQSANRVNILEAGETISRDQFETEEQYLNELTSRLALSTNSILNRAQLIDEMTLANARGEGPNGTEMSREQIEKAVDAYLALGYVGENVIARSDAYTWQRSAENEFNWQLAQVAFGAVTVAGPLEFLDPTNPIVNGAFRIASRAVTTPVRAVTGTVDNMLERAALAQAANTLDATYGLTSSGRTALQTYFDHRIAGETVNQAISQLTPTERIAFTTATDQIGSKLGLAHTSDHLVAATVLENILNPTVIPDPSLIRSVTPDDLNQLASSIQNRVETPAFGEAAGVARPQIINGTEVGIRIGQATDAENTAISQVLSQMSPADPPVSVWNGLSDTEKVRVIQEAAQQIAVNRVVAQQVAALTPANGRQAVIQLAERTTALTSNQPSAGLATAAQAANATVPQINEAVIRLASGNPLIDQDIDALNKAGINPSDLRIAINKVEDKQQLINVISSDPQVITATDLGNQLSAGGQISPDKAASVQTALQNIIQTPQGAVAPPQRESLFTRIADRFNTLTGRGGQTPPTQVTQNANPPAAPVAAPAQNAAAPAAVPTQDSIATRVRNLFEGVQNRFRSGGATNQPSTTTAPELTYRNGVVKTDDLMQTGGPQSNKAAIPDRFKNEIKFFDDPKYQFQVEGQTFTAANRYIEVNGRVIIPVRLNDGSIVMVYKSTSEGNFKWFLGEAADGWFIKSQSGKKVMDIPYEMDMQLKQLVNDTNGISKLSGRYSEDTILSEFNYTYPVGDLAATGIGGYKNMVDEFLKEVGVLDATGRNLEPGITLAEAQDVLQGIDFNSPYRIIHNKYDGTVEALYKNGVNEVKVTFYVDQSKAPATTGIIGQNNRVSDPIYRKIPFDVNISRSNSLRNYEGLPAIQNLDQGVLRDPNWHLLLEDVADSQLARDLGFNPYSAIQGRENEIDRLFATVKTPAELDRIVNAKTPPPPAVPAAPQTAGNPAPAAVAPAAPAAPAPAAAQSGPGWWERITSVFRRQPEPTDIPAVIVDRDAIIQRREAAKAILPGEIAKIEPLSEQRAAAFADDAPVRQIEREANRLEGFVEVVKNPGFFRRPNQVLVDQGETALAAVRAQTESAEDQAIQALLAEREQRVLAARLEIESSNPTAAQLENELTLARQAQKTALQQEKQLKAQVGPDGILTRSVDRARLDYARVINQLTGRAPSMVEEQQFLAALDIYRETVKSASGRETSAVTAARSNLKLGSTPLTPEQAENLATKITNLENELTLYNNSEHQLFQIQNDLAVAEAKIEALKAVTPDIETLTRLNTQINDHIVAEIIAPTLTQFVTQRPWYFFGGKEIAQIQLHIDPAGGLVMPGSPVPADATPLIGVFQRSKNNVFLDHLIVPGTVKSGSDFRSASLIYQQLDTLKMQPGFMGTKIQIETNGGRFEALFNNARPAPLSDVLTAPVVEPDTVYQISLTPELEQAVFQHLADGDKGTLPSLDELQQWLKTLDPAVETVEAPEAGIVRITFNDGRTTIEMTDAEIKVLIKNPDTIAVPPAATTPAPPDPAPPAAAPAAPASVATPITPAGTPGQKVLVPDEPVVVETGRAPVGIEEETAFPVFEEVLGQNWQTQLSTSLGVRVRAATPDELAAVPPEYQGSFGTNLITSEIENELGEPFETFKGNQILLYKPVTSEETRFGVVTEIGEAMYYTIELFAMKGRWFDGNPPFAIRAAVYVRDEAELINRYRSIIDQWNRVYNQRPPYYDGGAWATSSRADAYTLPVPPESRQYIDIPVWKSEGFADGVAVELKLRQLGGDVDQLPPAYRARYDFQTDEQRQVIKEAVDLMLYPETLQRSPAQTVVGSLSDVADNVVATTDDIADEIRAMGSDSPIQPATDAIGAGVDQIADAIDNLTNGPGIVQSLSDVIAPQTGTERNVQVIRQKMVNDPLIKEATYNPRSVFVQYFVIDADGLIRPLNSSDNKYDSGFFNIFIFKTQSGNLIVEGINIHPNTPAELANTIEATVREIEPGFNGPSHRWSYDEAKKSLPERMTQPDSNLTSSPIEVVEEWIDAVDDIAAPSRAPSHWAYGVTDDEAVAAIKSAEREIIEMERAYQEAMIGAEDAYRAAYYSDPTLAEAANNAHRSGSSDEFRIAREAAIQADPDLYQRYLNAQETSKEIEIRVANAKFKLAVTQELGLSDPDLIQKYALLDQARGFSDEEVYQQLWDEAVQLARNGTGINCDISASPAQNTLAQANTSNILGVATTKGEVLAAATSPCGPLTAVVQIIPGLNRINTVNQTAENVDGWFSRVKSFLTRNSDQVTGIPITEQAARIAKSEVEPGRYGYFYSPSRNQITTLAQDDSVPFAVNFTKTNQSAEINAVMLPKSQELNPLLLQTIETASGQELPVSAVSVLPDEYLSRMIDPATYSSQIVATVPPAITPNTEIQSLVVARPAIQMVAPSYPVATVLDLADLAGRSIERFSNVRQEIPLVSQTLEELTGIKVGQKALLPPPPPPGPKEILQQAIQLKPNADFTRGVYTEVHVGTDGKIYLIPEVEGFEQHWATLDGNHSMMDVERPDGTAGAWAKNLPFSTQTLVAKGRLVKKPQGELEFRLFDRPRTVTYSRVVPNYQINPETDFYARLTASGQELGLNDITRLDNNERIEVRIDASSAPQITQEVGYTYQGDNRPWLLPDIENGYVNFLTYAQFPQRVAGEDGAVTYIRRSDIQLNISASDARTHEGVIRKLHPDYPDQAVESILKEGQPIGISASSPTYYILGRHTIDNQAKTIQLNLLISNKSGVMNPAELHDFEYTFYTSYLQKLRQTMSVSDYPTTLITSYTNPEGQTMFKTMRLNQAAEIEQGLPEGTVVGDISSATNCSIATLPNSVVLAQNNASSNVLGVSSGEVLAVTAVPCSPFQRMVNTFKGLFAPVDPVRMDILNQLNPKQSQTETFQQLVPANP